MNQSKFTIFSAWSGLIYILLTGVAWIFFLRIVPAHSPNATAVEIARIYSEHQLSMSIGAMLMLLSCFFLSLFSSVVLQLIHKIEQHVGLLTINMAFSFGAAIIITMMAAVFWGSAGFRLERAPELTQTINDLGWLTFFTTAPPLFMAFIGMTVAAFMKNNKELGIIPKWYGFLSLWVLISIIPGPLAFFFKSGPFAWNGLIVFWFAFVVFGLNFLISPKVIVPAAKAHLV